MPSISELKEFSASFSDIANERNDVISKNLPFEELPLPNSEPLPLEPQNSSPTPVDARRDEPAVDFLDTIFDAPAEDDSPINNLDFSALLGGLPETESPPSLDDLFQIPTPETDDDFLQDMAVSFDDISPSLDDLSDSPSVDDSISNAVDLGGENQDSTLSSDFSSGSSTTEPVEDFSFPDDFELPQEMASEQDEDFSADDMPLTDFDSSFQDSDFQSDETETPAYDDFGFDDFQSNTDFSDFSEPADSPDIDALFSGIPDISDAAVSNDTDDTDGFQSDELPDFEDFGSDFESGSIDLGSETDLQASNDFELDMITDTSSDISSDDFTLPELDDFFDKGKKETPLQPKPQKKLLDRFKKDADQDIDEHEESSVNIEEIKLSQEDLDSMLKTLSGYPLNLRIACEELIAEQVLTPVQLSKLINDLINGVSAKEMAEFAGQLLGKKIVIPKSFEKSSGRELEAEKSSFAYIFVHNFLPVFKIFAFITVLALCVIYLGHRFIYTPIRAESIYRRGYELIYAGENQQANQLFREAFNMHPRRRWFYQYAQGFINNRRFLLAEQKYEELLRHFPRDRRGVLDFAHLQTHYLLNYERANRILQGYLLDFSPNDFDGLLAAGDNFFAWADSDPSRFSHRYEDARFAWARLLELYGWQAPIVERMMKYFIRTDNLREVLHLRNWFENNRRHQLSAVLLAELGGYLLDKQLEIPMTPSGGPGVPNPFVESIESVRDMLLQAVRLDVNLPEPHYHLARYHHSLGNTREERLTLENAIRAFDLARTESVRRRILRIDAHYRYANLLINNREFFAAEENLVRGINLYNDFMARNLIQSSPQLGRLFAARGNLEFFVKTGNMRAALADFHRAELHGWSPPEIQYRMGAAYYQLEDWENALVYFSKAASNLPLNRRMLHALGNTAFMRGNYFAAHGYFSRLLEILETQRNRLPVLLPNDRPEFVELGERLMMARNNAGVVYEALANQTGNTEFRARAITLYAESARAWDSVTRNPQTMERMRIAEMPGSPGINLGFLNAANAMRPSPDFTPQIFIRIDKDVLEPSHWEELAPYGGLVN